MLTLRLAKTGRIGVAPCHAACHTAQSPAPPRLGQAAATRPAPHWSPHRASCICSKRRREKLEKRYLFHWHAGPTYNGWVFLNLLEHISPILFNSVFSSRMHDFKGKEKTKHCVHVWTFNWILGLLYGIWWLAYCKGAAAVLNILLGRLILDRQ